MSRHSEGLGSRNASNSPDWTNVRCPSIISEYLSNVTVCGTPPDTVPGCAASIPLPAAAPAALAAWLPVAARAAAGAPAAAAPAIVITVAAAIRPSAWRRRREACRKQSRPARRDMAPPGVLRWDDAPSTKGLDEIKQISSRPPRVKQLLSLSAVSGVLSTIHDGTARA